MAKIKIEVCIPSDCGRCQFRTTMEDCDDNFCILFQRVLGVDCSGMQLEECKQAELKTNPHRGQGGRKMDLQNLATLVASLKAYHDELVRYAGDNFELGETLDYNDLETKVKNIEQTIDIIMDDFKYRMNN